jgi:hypothetical protein
MGFVRRSKPPEKRDHTPPQKYAGSMTIKTELAPAARDDLASLARRKFRELRFQMIDHTGEYVGC